MALCASIIVVRITWTLSAVYYFVLASFAIGGAVVFALVILFSFFSNYGFFTSRFFGSIQDYYDVVVPDTVVFFVPFSKFMHVSNFDDHLFQSLERRPIAFVADWPKYGSRYETVQTVKCVLQFSYCSYHVVLYIANPSYMPKIKFHRLITTSKKEKAKSKSLVTLYNSSNNVLVCFQDSRPVFAAQFRKGFGQGSSRRHPILRQNDGLLLGPFRLWIRKTIGRRLGTRDVCRRETLCGKGPLQGSNSGSLPIDVL